MSSKEDQQSRVESGDGPYCGTVHEEDIKKIRIDDGGEVFSVAFLGDGKYFVEGGREGNIRCWRVEDGMKVGPSMDVGSAILNIAVSRDAKWLVTGTGTGQVSVWDTESHDKVTGFKGHSRWVGAVDVSPDGTRFATGAEDKTACVWSLPTGQRLFSPLEHGSAVEAVKFSPDGRLLATATWLCSLRIYDSQNGGLLVDVPVKVGSSANRSLAWTGDSRQLFVMSLEGNIICLDASTGATHSEWPIHSSSDPRERGITLASDETFIAASADSSVSFWDTTTHAQIGSVIQHTTKVVSMAISANRDIVICGGNTVFFRSLCGILPSPYVDSISCEQAMQDLKAKITDLEGTIKSLYAREEKSNSEFMHLEETVLQLRHQLSNSQHAMQSLYDENAHLKEQLHAHEQKYKCETLYAEGRIIDAAVCLLEIADIMGHRNGVNSLIMDWIAEFKYKCISTLEMIGDDALSAKEQDEAAGAYSTALSLSPSDPDALLAKWASTVLAHSSLDEALSATTKFKLPKFVIYRTICDVLEENSRVSEAIECFRRNLLKIEPTSTEEAEWITNFKDRWLKTLEQRGDFFVDSASYEDAITEYTTALGLEPLSTGLLLKRSNARARIKLWQDSLEDADAVIKLDPWSPRGYERKHAALLGAHRYDEAIDTYNDMLLKLEQSPNPATRGLGDRYMRPFQTITAIRSRVKQTQRDVPLVLINTATGHLHDERGRLDEFEADPAFKELVASMTTMIDDSRIIQTVQEYFRYGTFSHTWEGAEPLFRDVLHQSVNDLAESPTVFKLVMFCVTIREAGLRWAWSDTCCINKEDPSVLQESLTSMFQWYHNSALTIIHLKGVLPESDLRALERCLWNTRAWTLQEFFASRVIRFYTEDWKPYHPHESMYNHKDSSLIMSEMSAATGVDSQVLLSLRPGSENVRQKLRLAAARFATKQEDIAYSLFGIFDVSILVNYGEGQQRALGRLLQEVLTRSGDVAILAWTGKPSEYNSCLPAEIGVYREPPSPYIPSAIEGEKMNTFLMELRTSSYLDSAVILYDRIMSLPSPRLFSRRLSLSCIKFPLKGLSLLSDGPLRVYRAVTSALGNVEIKTTQDLSSMKNLALVHPWLQCLVDPAAPSEDTITDDEVEPLTPVDEDGGSGHLEGFSPFSSDVKSPSYDKLTTALRIFVRLRQPFGALLLVSVSHNEYQRVASDQVIVAQLLKNVSPRYLLDKIQMLDIL